MTKNGQHQFWEEVNKLCRDCVRACKQTGAVQIIRCPRRRVKQGGGKDE